MKVSITESEDDMLIEVPVEGPVFYAVENQAQPPIPRESFTKYFHKNAQYAKKNSPEETPVGTVFVKFVVTTDGSLVNFEIMKGINKELNLEAVRLIRNMPKWKPATQNGKVVNSSYVLPIAFRL